MSENNETVKRDISDYGPNPFVTNLAAATRQNDYFRRTLWTGKHLQATLMSIVDEVGLEMHGDVDQFFYIEEGLGRLSVGQSKDNLNSHARVEKGFGIFIPAGTWHNIVNLGDRPLKLFTLYAPVQHPHGTIHITRQDAEREEHTPQTQGKENNLNAKTDAPK